MKKSNPHIVMATAAVLVAGLSGCNELNGMFEVKTALQLKVKKHETLTLQPGSYLSELKYDQGDRELKLKTKINGKEKEAKFKIPETVSIPTTDGEFTISAADSGQAYDLYGKLETKVTSSGPIHRIEACTWTSYEDRCWNVRVSAGHGQWTTRRHCERVSSQRSGTREREFTVTNTLVIGDAQLVDANLGVVGSFRGAQSYDTTVDNYYGPCLP